MVEEPQVGVDQSDALLIAGFNHNLVSSRAGWSCDVLDTTLHTQGGNVSEVRKVITATKCVQFEHMLQLEVCVCVAFTRLARSMLSLKGKKASELTATACRELIQFFFSVSDRSSGTSSYIDFQTAKSGPCPHKTSQ